MDLNNKNNELEEVSNKNKFLLKTYSNKINNLLLMINKLKKKYQSDIYILKSQINNSNQLFQNNIVKKGLELKGNINKMKNGINLLYKENQKNNENINRLKQEINIKENDNYNLKDALNKLSCKYNDLIKNSGNNEKIINGKVEKPKIKIQDNINQDKNK